MLSLIDILGKESILNETTAQLLVGRMVKIKGCVESGDFDTKGMVRNIELVKNIDGNGRFAVASIRDVKFGPFPINGGDLLELSCISEMEVARCSNQDCRSEVGMEEHDDGGLWCSRCGNVVSDALGDWILYKVEATSETVRLSRVR